VAAGWWRGGGGGVAGGGWRVAACGGWWRVAGGGWRVAAGGGGCGVWRRVRRVAACGGGVWRRRVAAACGGGVWRRRVAAAWGGGQQDDPKALGRLHARRKLQARSCTSGDNPATMRQPVQPGTYWQSRAANTPWSAPPTTTAAGQPYPRQILGPSNSALSKPNRCGERREGGRLTYPLLPRRGTRPRVSWQCSATRHPGMLVRVSEW